ncbi:hypothetical protein D043_0719, partial [Vibrio parahaemolyticus EKP-021]
TSATLT